MERASKDGGITYLELWLLGLQSSDIKILFVLMLLDAVICMLTWSAWVPFLFGTFIGLSFWFTTEYLLHRFLLHLPAPRSQFLLKFHQRLHWTHHQTPDCREFLFVPFWAVIPMILSVTGLAVLLQGGLAIAPALLGFLLFFMIYESSHLAAHVAYHPKTRLGRTMKKHHRLHHYKNEAYWYGVTHPMMDLIFGTWKPFRNVKKSGTARDPQRSPSNS